MTVGSKTFAERPSSSDLNPARYLQNHLGFKFNQDSPSLTARRDAEVKTFGQDSSWAGHNFGAIGVQSGLSGTGLISVNSARDDEGDEDVSAQQETPGGIPRVGIETPIGGSGEGATPLEEKKEQSKCPTKTVVEKVIDMTPDGIKKGYRTGYGAAAVIRVEPTETNWDGTKIVEANKQTRNTCPEEFGISPCSGADTFTVGAESNSSVIGKLAATQNHFYDFHTTRWNKGSLLHDRNPKDIDSCEVACEQKYSCDGKVIGTHSVTRTFTKGKSGTRDVTLVNVKKT